MGRKQAIFRTFTQGGLSCNPLRSLPFSSVNVSCSSPYTWIMNTITTKNYAIAHFDEISALPCPCGLSQRAFATPDNQTATIHKVDIREDAQVHYHKKLTEIYLILETEGEAFIELDGEKFPLKPMTTVMIKPGCRHRAIGKMKLINVSIPAFDPGDEWLDEMPPETPSWTRPS